MIMKNGKVEHNVRLMVGKGVGVTRSIERRDITLVPRNVLGFQFQTRVTGDVELDGQTLAVSSEGDDTWSAWHYVDAQVSDLMADLPDGARTMLNGLEGLNINFSSVVRLSDGSYTEHAESDKFVAASDLGPADPTLDELTAEPGSRNALLIAFMRSSER